MHVVCEPLTVKAHPGLVDLLVLWLLGGLGGVPARRAGAGADAHAGRLRLLLQLQLLRLPARLPLLLLRPPAHAGSTLVLTGRLAAQHAGGRSRPW